MRPNGGSEFAYSRRFHSSPRVDTRGLLATDPLTPAMKINTMPELLTGCLGISDEPRVSNPCSAKQSARPSTRLAKPDDQRIGVRALERQDVKRRGSFHRQPFFRERCRNHRRAQATFSLRHAPRPGAGRVGPTSAAGRTRISIELGSCRCAGRPEGGEVVPPVRDRSHRVLRVARHLLFLGANRRSSAVEEEGKRGWCCERGPNGTAGGRDTA
jgi:hypothetical protein